MKNNFVINVDEDVAEYLDRRIKKTNATDANEVLNQILEKASQQGKGSQNPDTLIANEPDGATR